MTRQVDKIIIHCSATRDDMDVGVDWIRDLHVNEFGWSDVGYNYILRRDGTLEPGRDLDGDGDVEEEIGAHARGFNSRSIGICLIGGVDANNTAFAEANYTRAQWRELERVVARLLDKYPGAEVLGHKDLPGVSKACPCFDVRAWWYG